LENGEKKSGESKEQINKRAAREFTKKYAQLRSGSSGEKLKEWEKSGAGLEQAT